MFQKSFMIFSIISVILLPRLLTAETGEIPQRSDIDDKYKWNLEVLYPDLDSWEKDFGFVKENYVKLETYKGRLSESADLLYECLKLNEKLEIVSDDLRTYAGLKLSEDNRVSKYQELSGRIRGLQSQVNHASSFIEAELLSIDSDKLMSFLDQKEELEIYRFYFNDLIRKKKHILSPDEEAILALSGSIAYSSGRVYSMLTNADMDLGEVYDEDSNLVRLTEERYDKMRKSFDRRVRRESHEAYYGSYDRYANTMAASLDGALKKDQFFMKARNYESCLDMSLYRNNIPTSVFHNLIKTVNENIEPLHRWAELKKKVLGVDSLYPYDLYVPLTKDVPKEMSYEEAMEIVLDGVKVMGEPYYSDFKMGLESGWIDVYETEGKSSGAFSGGSYNSPPYISLNFNGTLDWAFTLAHEMGHSMQSYYVKKKEPYIYTGYSTFVAEVASTGAEAVVLKTMLKNAKDEKEKMYLLNYYIYQIRTTFFRQIMFAEFEYTIHKHMEEGGAFSADYFRQTFREIYQKYWGEALTVDELGDMLSMAVPHFYWQYYVYQYATSFAAAQVLSQQIVDGEPGAVENYIDFLATGSSAYPVETLKKAGVDMTKPDAILQTIQLFSDLVDEYEKLLQKEHGIEDLK